MKNKLCLLLASAGLLLGVAAPAQANTVSPTSLDFGTFAANAVPNTVLSVNVTSGGPNAYFAGVEMTAGKAYFYPFSSCMETDKDFEPCTVSVRMGSELTATGPLVGTLTVKFSDDGQASVPPVTETQTVEVKANITPALSTPPVVPPSIVPPTTTTPTTKEPVRQQPKRPCKKGQRSTKGKPCTKAKGKKGHKGGGKSKGK